MPSAPSPPLPRLPPLRICGHPVAAENANAARPVACGAAAAAAAPTICASTRRLPASLRPAARFTHSCTADARGDSQHFKFKRRRRMLCQCSSARLEHSPCKRKVVGSDPIIGFLLQKTRARGAAQHRDPAWPASAGYARSGGIVVVIIVRPFSRGSTYAVTRRDLPHRAVQRAQPCLYLTKNFV